jgi:hypothetical protein
MKIRSPMKHLFAFPKFPGILLLAAGMMLITPACNDDTDLSPDASLTSSYPADVVIAWNELLLEVDRYTPGYLPPVSGRAFGYIGLAVYETAVPGMPAYKSLRRHFAGLDLPAANRNLTYSYPAAINSAYYRMIEHLYPDVPAAQYNQVLALYQQFAQTFEREVSPSVMSASVDWGRDVADAVFAWSATDPVGHEGYLRPFDPAYVPPSGPGKWQPTYPDFIPARLPHWGDVRTFAARTDDKAYEPLPYSTDPTSEFYVQALETENKVNLIRQGQNYEDKWIAQFWSDDCAALTFTPAGRWIAIATQALENTNADLAKAAVVTAKTGMALCDAGIRCWAEKYRYNLLRPVDYIRNVMGHEPWNSIMCPDGAGQFFTPQFPTYPSGHGTFSAAAAEVLTAEFGQHVVFTDRCHEGRSEFIGTPRTYNSFYEMAGENAYSRLPIGVHFRMDAEAALDLGFTVGRRVNALPWQ